MPDLLRKHPLIVLIAVLIAGLLVWGFWPQPVLVEATSVSRAPLTVSIEEEGRTRVIDRYVITAPVDGIACRLQHKVGNAVEQDQVLLGITPMLPQILDPRSRAQAEARLAAAESALHAAEEQARAAAASAQLASSELDRQKPLLEKSLISREVFERAQTAARTSAAAKRSADFRVEVARYEREVARTTLQYSSVASKDSATERVLVRSPISGRILKIARECEGPVRTGEALVEVGDPRVLEVEVDVLSADAVKIKPGMTVQFERWGGEQPLQGVVRIVEPVGFTKVSALGVEEQRVLIISNFTSPPEHWQQLGDGYRVEAQFILWQQEDVLQVPASSLFRYREGWAVFMIVNDRATRREVKVGQRNGLTAQILAGLDEGDMVIIHPGDAVDHGKRVIKRHFDQ